MRTHSNINGFITLTDKEDIESHTHINLDDKDDKYLLLDFIKWYGSTEIEISRFEDKWEHYLDVMALTDRVIRSEKK